jgi:hypothetical protein
MAPLWGTDLEKLLGEALLYAEKHGLCLHGENCRRPSRLSRPWSRGQRTPNARWRRTEHRADGRFKELQLASGAIVASLHRELAELSGSADDLRRQLKVAESNNSELQLKLLASGYSKDVQSEVLPLTSGSAESTSGLTASETPDPTKRRRRRKQRPKLVLDDDVLAIAPGRRKSERRGAGSTAGPSMVELNRTRTSKHRDLARRSARDDKYGANDDAQLLDSRCEQFGRRGPDLTDETSIATLEQHEAKAHRDLERHSAQDGKADAEVGVLLVDSSCEQPGRRGPELTDGPSIDTLERHGAVDSSCEQPGRRGPELTDGPSIDTLERHGAATRRDLERHSAQDGKANAEAGVLLVDSSCEQPGRRGPELTDGTSETYTLDACGAFGKADATSRALTGEGYGNGAELGATNTDAPLR